MIQEIKSNSGQVTQSGDIVICNGGACASRPWSRRLMADVASDIGRLEPEEVALLVNYRAIPRDKRNAVQEVSAALAQPNLTTSDWERI